MATTIDIPDFDFSGFYYPQILEALVAYKRRNVPEITDESEYEPFIQLLRMVALVGHMNNVNLDIAANEGTLPTARLQATVRNMLKLIGYQLAPTSPAQAPMLYKLAKVLVATTEVVPYRAPVSTRRQGDVPPITFEADAAIECSRTDMFTSVLGYHLGAFTDFTAQANDRTPGSPWQPLGAAPAAGDAVYFGHAQALWDKLYAEVLAPASGIAGVWEYYDGNWLKTIPSSVTDLGGTLEFDLTSYLGTDNRQGTVVRVYRNDTMTFEQLTVAWSGTANVVTTTGYLGQTAPSTDPADYTVGSDWEPLPNSVDGTSLLSASGAVEYDVPQDEQTNWAAGEVDAVSCYWVRFRVVTATGAPGPSLDWATMDAGKQWVLGQSTQGKSITEDPLGSSTGEPSQRFDTARDYFLGGTMEVTVDGTPWVEVDTFLESQANDLHFRVELGDNDRATVVFGDGQSGRVPPAGTNNIVATYRYGAEDDGNVGALTITSDRSGLSAVSSLANPRPATGWKPAEGSTPETLEQAKVAGPATLRTREVALGPEDVESLSVAFRDGTGASPFSRARAFEEGYGPKTIEVAVVASGGGLGTPAQLAALQQYLNGDRTTYPPLPKRIVANQQAVTVNYTPRVIDVTVTVYGDVEEETVRNKLAAVIQPEARMEDGVTWEWDFGALVPTSRIVHEVFTSDPDIKRVDLAVPASNVQLEPRELPVLGTLTITVVR